MKWKIEICGKSDAPDIVGGGILEDIADLGIAGVTSVRTVQIYWIEGNIDSQAVERICSNLLADPVTQHYIYGEIKDDLPSQGVRSALFTNTWAIEIRFKSGVTDAVADSVLKGIRDANIMGVQAAQTGEKYWIQGSLDRAQLEIIAQRLLANEVIQTFEIHRES